MAKVKKSAPKKIVKPTLAASGLSMVLSHPAVRTAATGIASALLVKLATSISERYPQIATVMHEGLDSIEGKLTDYNSNKQ